MYKDHIVLLPCCTTLSEDHLCNNKYMSIIYIFLTRKSHCKMEVLHINLIDAYAYVDRAM